jgi:hypothetical protein
VYPCTGVVSNHNEWVHKSDCGNFLLQGNGFFTVVILYEYRIFSNIIRTLFTVLEG